MFNIFLQIFDEGRLTDGRGRMVNFKNTIIILTSNLGSEIYQEEKDGKKQEQKILEKVQKFFRPEIINRLDSIIIYHSLNLQMMKKIVDLQLNLLKERLKKQSLDLEVSQKIKDYLLKVGFDEVYGARPLKRVINDLITDEIALQIVEGKIKPNDKIMVDFKNSKVIIEVRKVN